jgi:hypothetical protein
MGAVLLSYPLMVVEKLINESFWELAVFHVLVLGGVAWVYTLRRSIIPKQYQVHPIWFLSMAVMMPVTYVLLTPLALFTLDSSNWETRGHQAATPPAPAPILLTAAQVSDRSLGKAKAA